MSNDITPNAEQASAIKNIVEWYKSDRQEFYLAGFAGVGKSTVVSIAIEELKAQCGVKCVRTAAYTGKAASVLRKKGIADAQTIHSLIYIPYEDEETGELRFAISEESPAATSDLIVLDECSMVDKLVAKDLRDFSVKTLIIGDPGQLPPINGEGAFTNRDPDVFLREIHRQAADSPIISMATLARQGKPLPIGYENGKVRVLPLNKDTQPLIYREETQPLCGLNRVSFCYTQRIRKLRGFDGELPQVGERVICCRNNREEGLFNGGMGSVLSVDGLKPDGTMVMDVKMDDLSGPTRALRVDPYLFRRHFTNGESQKLKFPKGMPWPQEYDHGVALTVHKAQGSSWDDVTVIDDSHAFREHKANHLYTAITRAERALTVLVREAA